MRFIPYSSLVVGLISARDALGFVAPSHRATTASSSTVSRHESTFVKSSPITPTPFAISTSTSTGTTTQLFGWGPDPIWSTAFVESNIQACPSGSCVSLKVNVDDGSEFIYPGQYVQVKPAGDDNAKPIFLAMASAPTGIPPKPISPSAKSTKDADIAAGPEPTPTSPVPGTWEFLIKKTDNNDWITSVSPGSSISISQVMGSGFAMRENLEGFKYDFPTQNVLLFATGSGIAPIRSAIESNQLNIAKMNSGGRTCTLYYGVRTPDDMPYVSKFPEWEAMGVQVVPVVSQPDMPCASGTVWNGRTGYVQNALEEDGVAIPRNSGALLCGVNGMCDSVKSLLLESGVFEGRILKNF